MKITIIGAGIIGVMSAWRLAKAGHEVTVIDSAATPGAGASAANGAQLSWRYTDPMASPSVLASLWDILGGRDPGIRVGFPLRFSFYPWALWFLAECLKMREAKNAEQAFRLAQTSEQEFAGLMKEVPFDFNYRVSGKLIIYRDTASFEAAALKLRRKQAWGADMRALSAPQCVALDPALSTVSELAGGLYAPHDACGDCESFTQNLAQLLQARYGVTFKMGVKATGFRAKNNHVEALLTNEGEHLATHYVIAAGNGSQHLALDLNLWLPIEPVKGYSLTLPAHSNAPQLSVTDAARRIVVCRLGSEFRISGFAEMVGFDREVYPDKIEKLRSAAREMFPQSADFSAAGRAWAGFRPSTPSGLPLVGGTRYGNLSLNTGHGMFGWTLGAVSAALLEAHISKR